MPRPSHNRTLRSYYMGQDEDLAIQAIQLHHGFGSISDAVRFAVRTTARDLPELKQLEESARAEAAPKKAATSKAAPKKKPASKPAVKSATKKPQAKRAAR
jgi:Arc/MetJ-type ribon-helix-helix transcriptional regulator